MIGAGLGGLLAGFSVHPYRDLCHGGGHDPVWGPCPAYAPDDLAVDYARLRGMLASAAGRGAPTPIVVNSEMGYSPHACEQGIALGCIDESTQAPRPPRRSPARLSRSEAAVPWQAMLLSRQWLSDAGAGVRLSVWYDRALNRPRASPQSPARRFDLPSAGTT